MTAPNAKRDRPRQADPPEKKAETQENTAGNPPESQEIHPDKIAEIKARAAAKSQARKKKSDPAPADPPENTHEDCTAALALGERGDADKYVGHVGESRLYDHETGAWFLFQEGSHYTEDRTDATLAEVTTVLPAIYAQAAATATTRANEAAAEGLKAAADLYTAQARELRRRVQAVGSVRRARNILELAASIRLGTTGADWDRHPHLLACSNGVIDLETGIFRPGRPADRIRRAATIPWPETGLETPAQAWEQFLLSTFDGDESLLDYYQKMIGMSFLGISNHRTFHIHTGPPSAGKTEAFELLGEIAGQLAGPIPAELLLDQGRPKNPDAPSPTIAGLRGMRLVWASETNDGTRFSPAQVKWLTGGDTMIGRSPYAKSEIRFRPTHTLHLLTNHKPNVGADQGFFARTRVIERRLSFVVGREPQADHERPGDPHLRERLRADTSGILPWIVRGALAYQRDGLTPTPAILAATAEYLGEQDLIGLFLAECVISAPDSRVQAQRMFDAYEGWCKSQGIRGKRLITFGRDLTQREFQKRRDGAYYWLDVRLTTEGEAYADQVERKS
jgi:putative DNA primase/helicase